MRWNHFLQVAFFFEALLALGAMAAGWLLGISPWYRTGEPLSFTGLTQDLLWGLAATAPAAAFLLLEENPLWRSLTDLKEQVSWMLQRLLCGSTQSQLFVLALLAGLGEELLFRGLLQAGLTRLLPTPLALVGSLVIASILFGLCHCMSHTYFLLATLAGFYFGLLMIVSGSIIPPIIAHALYDFIALVYLLHEHQKQAQVTRDWPMRIAEDKPEAEQPESAVTPNTTP